MKQIIKTALPSNVIEFSEVIENLKSCSIVVQIYQNKYLTFLSLNENILGNYSAGFRNIRLCPNYNYNTVSSNPETALKRGFDESPNNKFYIFDSLQDLAKAIVTNGWE